MSKTKLNAGSQEVAKYYCDEFKLKLLNRQFMAQMGIASALLNAGYSVTELKSLIDYAKKYQPDMYSLAFLQYVGSEWLASIKVAEMSEKIITAPIQTYEELEQVSNKDKFDRTKKATIKGTLKI